MNYIKQLHVGLSSQTPLVSEPIKITNAAHGNVSSLVPETLV